MSLNTLFTPFIVISFILGGMVIRKIGGEKKEILDDLVHLCYRETKQGK